MRIRTRWWLRRGIVCVLLGVATSVVIAWYFAVHSGLTYTIGLDVYAKLSQPPHPRDRAGFSVVTTTGRALRVVRLTAWNGTPGLTHAYTEFGPEAISLLPIHLAPNSAYPITKPEWPPWLPRIPVGPEHTYSEWSARATGWPMRCMVSRWVERRSQPGVRGIIGGWNVGDYVSHPRDSSHDHGWGIIPFIPYWPGLVVNSAAFGAAWMIVLAVLPASRRWVRRARGRCETCGYDLRGNPSGGVCPECGR